ncbi:Fe-S cluster assembly ATPase SufC [Candidatus Microgenomates bacterium]|nr:Fe-S cluster assembly ATPase SufC [Candidatus Microgenomates bacterium]
MLTVKNLSVSVADKPIIKNFSYDFEQDKVYVVMGPNGSGKSTLAYSLMGHPSYTIKEKSKIVLNKTNLVDLEADKRSEAGIFLSFQSPLSLSGVTVQQLLLTALSGKIDPLTLRQKTRKLAEELKIPEELLKRSLNEGASGGEKKKLEVLQGAVLDKEVQIYDEVDTGVDVDALRTIATFLHRHKAGKTYIIITHYNRILKYLKPDHVLVLVNGSLVKEGDYELAKQIEKKGYSDLS